ncbi:MAG: hypothetical protein ACKVZ0_16305 [Gemmatimonadales bacterium]
MPANSTSTRGAIIAIVSLLGSTALPAQQYWAERGAGALLRTDLLKPFFKGDGNQFLNGTVALSGSGRIGTSVRLEAEVPLARAGFDAGTLPSQSSIRFGNPYLGVQFHQSDRPWSGRIGVRLPLASEPSTAAGLGALGVGVLADPDRLEAYLPNVMTVRTDAEVRSVTVGGFLIGAKFGSSLLIPTKGESGDPELFGDYGVRGGYESPSVRATVGLTGRLLATESGLSFSDRTFHAITGAVDLRRGAVRPSVMIRIPLDSAARDAAGAILGIGLTVVL